MAILAWILRILSLFLLSSSIISMFTFVQTESYKGIYWRATKRAIIGILFLCISMYIKFGLISIAIIGPIGMIYSIYCIYQYRHSI
jgi:hypothetical protein